MNANRVLKSLVLNRVLPFLLVWMIVLSAATAHAAQVTATWTGEGDGTSWNNAANWSTPNFPNNGTPAGTTYNVVIDGNSGATANVALNVTVTIDALSVNSGDSLAFGNSRQITVVNSGAGTGTITNVGTITLNLAGTSPDLIINGNVTLSGGGTMLTLWHR